MTQGLLWETLRNPGTRERFLASLRKAGARSEALLQVVVPGNPVGKGRPRVRRDGRTFTPPRTAAWEKQASGLFKQAWGVEKPLDRPVAVWVEAVKARPKNRFRKKDPDGRLWRTKKPDGDNVVKAVCDALQKAAIVEDDARIVEIFYRGYYTARGEEPGVHVTVFTLEGDW